jgi:hypothetical protein
MVPWSRLVSLFAVGALWFGATAIACSNSRRDVRILFWESDAPKRILVGIGSCRAEIDKVATEETASEVRIKVWVKGGTNLDCADGVTIELEEPVGDRKVIDEESGEVVPRGP